MTAQEKPRRRWPWIALLLVILFFVISTLWVLALVQRVRRIKESNQGMTNAALPVVSVRLAALED